MKNLSEDCQ